MSSNFAEQTPTVQITFTFNGARQESEILIDAASVIDINYVSSEALNSNTSFEYAGRYDNGLLPQLKFDQINGNIISSLQDAKRACDEFLTDCMKTEIEAPVKAHHLEKKPRIDLSWKTAL